MFAKFRKHRFSESLETADVGIHKSFNSVFLTSWNPEILKHLKSWNNHAWVCMFTLIKMHVFVGAHDVYILMYVYVRSKQRYIYICMCTWRYESARLLVQRRLIQRIRSCYATRVNNKPSTCITVCIRAFVYVHVHGCVCVCVHEYVCVNV